MSFTFLQFTIVCQQILIDEKRVDSFSVTTGTDVNIEIGSMESKIKFYYGSPHAFIIESRRYLQMHFKSECSKTNAGVRQGSVLSPKSFLYDAVHNIKYAIKLFANTFALVMADCYVAVHTIYGRMHIGISYAPTHILFVEIVVETISIFVFCNC